MEKHNYYHTTIVNELKKFKRPRSNQLVLCNLKYCLLFLNLMILFCGCAIQYTDSNGARHIIGINHTVVKEISKEKTQIIAQRVSTIGIGFLVLPEHSGFSIGYANNFIIEINSQDLAGYYSFSLDDPTDVDFRELQEIIGEIK